MALPMWYPARSKDPANGRGLSCVARDRPAAILCRPHFTHKWVSTIISEWRDRGAGDLGLDCAVSECWLRAVEKISAGAYACRFKLGDHAHTTRPND